jgi:hypothetical protein
VIILGLITVLGSIGFVGDLAAGGTVSAFRIVWLAVMGALWYQSVLRVAYEVRLWPATGRLEFKSLIGSKETTLGSVTQIRGRLGNHASARFHFGDTRAWVSLGLDGMTDLVHRIREANPSLVVRNI